MTLNSIVHFSGRLLIGLLFAGAALRKITGYNEVGQHMAEVGLPEMLLPLVILFEAATALMIITGWQMRYAATALAIFCIMTAFIFHFDFQDAVQRVMFAKNLAIAGGLLILISSPRPIKAA